MKMNHFSINNLSSVNSLDFKQLHLDISFEQFKTTSKKTAILSKLDSNHPTHHQHVQVLLKAESNHR
jgi:hypothetical protein